MREVSKLFFCIFVFIQLTLASEEICYKDDFECRTTNSKNRYIFYDINPSEGFNLRRDVYRRFAVLVKQLSESSDPRLKNFKLVLPPWSHLYHWTYSEQAELIPWGYYFDMDNLKSFAPVIEMYEFFQEQPSHLRTIEIDEVYILKNFGEMMRSGKFSNKMEVTHCEEDEPLNYFYYTNMTSKIIKCLKFHGPSSELVHLLLSTPARMILFARAEVVLHPTFGDSLYWSARRSLRYNKEMRAIASAFRRSHLHSNDDADNTHLPTRWQEDQPRRDAIGGPYVAVHMRRRDFFIGRPHEFPTLEVIAKQITHQLERLGLTTVFLATDAPTSDVESLMYYLPKDYLLVKFTPLKSFTEHYRDGGTAIIDQLVCAHARYYIGTAESTFTFRIFEEREIIGFPLNHTYNVLCADEDNCEKPSIWKIVY